MRPSSFLCKKLKRRSLVRIAVCSLTGMVTSPKLIAPDQIAWATVFTPRFLGWPGLARFGDRRFEPLWFPMAAAPEVASLAEQADGVLQREARELSFGFGRALAGHGFDFRPVERHRDRRPRSRTYAERGHHRLPPPDLHVVEVDAAERTFGRYTLQGRRLGPAPMHFARDDLGETAR